jgi:hypothetical protein
MPVFLMPVTDCTSVRCIYHSVCFSISINELGHYILGFDQLFGRG